MGAIKQALPSSLEAADLVYVYGSQVGKDAIHWDLRDTFASLGEKVQSHHQLDALVRDIVDQAQAGDSILVMSNGGFGGVHQLLLDALTRKFQTQNPA
jgi:UDP-N-acetylmuramate: L-alanyl-gamma-D-glutamyl-meso-diaminopimelate ligase